MFNLSRITKIMSSLALTVALMGNAHAASQNEESTGQFVDDSVITTRVKAAIFADSTLKTLQINVKTFQGIVQLSGFVDSAQNITTAGKIVRSVNNVTSVKNDLIVK
jgi:osmotically-inducible protein OsmY